MKALLLAGLFACIASAAAAPTFNKDIAPILYENCSTCHRPGEVAPFPLLTYRDAAKRAGLIAMVTQKRYMPPWKPEPGYGNFDHVRRLTDEQIAQIQEWAATGAPEGDAADKPAVPTFASGWQAGEPDQVLKMSAPYAIAGGWPGPVPLFRAADEPDQGIVRQRRRISPGQSEGGASCADLPGFDRRRLASWRRHREEGISLLRRSWVCRRGTAGGLGSRIHSPARGTGAFARQCSRARPW